MKVHKPAKEIDKDWLGLRSIIQVKRTVKKSDGTLSKETAYFISSLPATTDASVFNQGIRGHWSIENSLHYLKDKTFGEDSSRIRTKNAPENLSVIRNIVINVLKKKGWNNIAQAIRLVSNNIGEMYKMITA